MAQFLLICQPVFNAYNCFNLYTCYILSSIDSLSSLPKEQEIKISIYIDDELYVCHFQAIEKFEKLAKLHVNNITINSWEEVSKLRWFPALTDVRMIHWDLFGVCHLKLDLFQFE